MVENLEKKASICPIELGRDKSGAYISYCNFRAHPGIIIEVGKADDCFRKECKHYMVYRAFLRR